MPALVLIGDDDVVMTTHTWSLYESLPASQLPVIPGASHLAPYEEPELVAQLVADLRTANGIDDDAGSSRLTQPAATRRGLPIGVLLQQEPHAYARH